MNKLSVLKKRKDIREEMRRSGYQELDNFEFLVDCFATEENKNLDYDAQLYKAADTPTGRYRKNRR